MSDQDITVFNCGFSKKTECEHDWSGPMEPDGMGGHGVTCTKCQCNFGEYIMWADFGEPIMPTAESK